jgi:FkbM family methyltransferase
MRRSKTNSGFLFFLEKIVRSHPLLYFITRYFIRYTNIFEQDANGVTFLNLDKKVNIIDVGASDGIASKFFSRKLKINKIICFEPNKSYVKILKKLNIKNLVVNAYGIGQYTKYYKIFIPRYKFFSKNLDLITYAYYNKQTLQDKINSDFKFKKNISIVEDKIYLKKIKKIKTKIDLIKIDVNGHELSIVKGLSKIIKRDKPALIIETGDDIKIIERYLKKYGFNKYLFSNRFGRFEKIKKNYPLNTYFLQKNHLRLDVI